ncbi:ROK family protein [Sphingobacterium pedocola]|uniref:ROK family protein n=1 Tax=Sphingobacterium pedocola TaxID=2082722 RepID=A0ABR9T3Q2_9SPHI|nr:ROK family protein [Sphingobacterium pedocola]MBE8719983.1 ROK family protein [Sphingobacterium pedocola]
MIMSLEISILKSLYFTNPQSIADLSNDIGKSLPNITKTVNVLLEKGIIVENGLAPSTGGRRPVQFSLHVENLPYILAIAIDQYYTSIALVDFSNRAIKPTETITIDLKESVSPTEEIKKLIDDYLQFSNTKDILAIGITAPGFVDSHAGVNNSHPKDSDLYNLRKIIEDHSRIPTYIENDSTAIAIAEQKLGSIKDIDHALVVNLNWGVGLGMIIDHKLFKGHSGYAGEFSHIPLSNLNKLCSCGKKGCLEVEASLLAAVESATEKMVKGEQSLLSPTFRKTRKITGDELLDAAVDGDQLAIEAINKIGYMLGKGIATLIHIINPAKIIISGRGAKVGHILTPQIQSAILEFSIHRLSKNTAIEISKLENAQLLGSACIAVEHSKWKNLKLESIINLKQQTK